MKACSYFVFLTLWHSD